MIEWVLQMDASTILRRPENVEAIPKWKRTDVFQEKPHSMRAQVFASIHLDQTEFESIMHLRCDIYRVKCKGGMPFLLSKETFLRRLHPPKTRSYFLESVKNQQKYHLISNIRAFSSKLSIKECLGCSFSSPGYRSIIYIAVDGSRRIIIMHGRRSHGHQKVAHQSLSLSWHFFDDSKWKSKEALES